MLPPPLFRVLLRNTPTIAPVPNRRVLSVFGSQASEFLNGILSSSVQDPIKGPTYSAFLHAQGRVLYDVFLYTTKDASGRCGFLLDYDARASEAPPLLSLVKRYVLRAKVKIRDVSEEYDVWAAWGSSKDKLWETPRQWSWARSGAVEPVWDKAGDWPWGTEDEALLDRRAIGMGQRMLVGKSCTPKEASAADIVSSDAYTLHRILHGVPEGLTDIPAMQAFPMDSNLDVMGGLDFRKGCYVGQELTVRTYHTGVVRKRILPVVIHEPNQKPEEIVTPSSEVYLPGQDIRPSVIQRTGESGSVPKPRGSGKLLSSAQGLGLALLRLEHVEGVQKGDLRLEFEAANGQDMVTKAVSPWWPDWWPKQPASEE